MGFLSFSENFQSTTKMVKVIFQVPIGGHTCLKPFKGNFSQRITLLQSTFQEFGINEVVQLHPNIKDEKLVRTYEIRFLRYKKADILIERVKSEIDVAYAEKKELHKSFLTPNDTYFTNSFNNGMWCLYQVNAPQAWDISTGDANIVVAVTDNAIQVNHPDLVNKNCARKRCSR